MKVKMLQTVKGTLNNGLGNITIDYIAGNIYDACMEEAMLWIEQGIAIPAEQPVAKDVTAPKDNDSLRFTDIKKIVAKPKRRK
jgi:hypothetical protein